MHLLVITAFVLLLPLSSAVPAQQLPLFDAHVHYSEDAWPVLSAHEAVERLRQAGVVRALVSSSGDEGTQRLYEAAPELIVPALRPYRQRGTLDSWMLDETVISYLEHRLARYEYVAIGEFHVSGPEADYPVVKRLVALAREHGLILHAHADGEAVKRLFAQDPDARILWAHAGFEAPERVRAMLRRHPNLWADLSFRREIAPNGTLMPEWRELFADYPDRFMLGSDTYTPERWNQVDDHAEWARQWLQQLPAEVAERIAYKNGERILTTAFRRRMNAARNADGSIQPRALTARQVEP